VPYFTNQERVDHILFTPNSGGMRAKIIAPRFLFKHSNEADDFDGGIDGSSEKEEEAEIAKGASHALCRVAG